MPALLAVSVALFFALFGSYTARSTFVPQSSSGGLAGLIGLAAQFGTRLPGGLGQDPTESIDFYASVIRSPALLARVSLDTFSFAKSEKDSTVVRGTLAQLYGISGDTRQEELRNLIERLQNRVAASVNRVNGTVVVSVKAPWPGMAQAVNRRLLVALNEFNLLRRRESAKAQREFLEERTIAASVELRRSEDSLRTFSERNRTYSSDPALALEAARLSRAIEMRQAVYTTLLQSLEQSRLEEVRNTPLITVLDEPELYAKRSRSPVLMGAAAFAVSGGLAITAVFLLQFLANASADSGSAPAFVLRVLAWARQRGMID